MCMAATANVDEVGGSKFVEHLETKEAYKCQQRGIRRSVTGKEAARTIGVDC